MTPDEFKLPPTIMTKAAVQRYLRECFRISYDFFIDAPEHRRTPMP
jgi:hypothetical protein